MPRTWSILTIPQFAALVDLGDAGGGGGSHSSLVETIDPTSFQLSQGAGVAIAVMVGFLVFAVALDLTWAKLRRVLESPVAPGIGLAAQLVVLPAVAFAIGLAMAATPSVALGLTLVACCPGGALSNYLTGVAKGDVATSISMTAVSTAASLLVTPLLFAFWAALNPAASEALREIAIEPKRWIAMLLVMLGIPVAAGMLLRAKRPAAADAIRGRVRRIAALVFAVVVAGVLGSNLELLVSHARLALTPVLLTFTGAGALGWGLARALGRSATERRAVVFEVCMQNVALAIAMAVAFFPALGGVAVTAALWGIVHLTLGVSLAVCWRRIPLEDQGRAPAASHRSPA
jgi:bile acid:Na+ symporter, BASS family